MITVFDFEDIKNLSINEISKEILKANSSILREIKIFDLITYQDTIISNGNGVYIFYDNEKVWYVGKAQSRSFIERIPAHFDVRAESWFNTILKKVINHGIAVDYNAAIKVVGELKLLLINFNNVELINPYCKNTEKLLILKLNPILNSYSKNTVKRQEAKIDYDDSLINNLNKI